MFWHEFGTNFLSADPLLSPENTAYDRWRATQVKSLLHPNPPIEFSASTELRPGQPFRPYKLFYGIFIPEALVRFKGVSPGAKILYGQLVRHAGNDGRCFPKQATLAKEISVVDRQIRTYLRELQDQGFVRVKQNGLRRPNEYVFLWHPIFNGTDRKDSSGQERKSGSGPERKHSTGPITKESSEESQLKESPSSSSDGMQIMKTPPPTPSPASPEPARTKPIKNRIDDDEEQSIEFEGTRDELVRFIEKATGTPPDGKLIEIIEDRLRLREVTIREYLEDIRPRIKRLKRRPGPGFFLSQAAEPSRSKTPVPERRPQICAKCGGIGRTGEGQYCDCRMGRDLERVELPSRKGPQSGSAIVEVHVHTGTRSD